MNKIQILLAAWFSSFKKEFNETIFIVKAKGFKHFQRVLLGSLFMLFIAYWGVYKLMGDKLSQVESQIETAHITAKYADLYKNASGQFLQAQRRLPPFKDKDTWLTNAGIASLRAEGLASNSMSSPEESKMLDLKREKISIEFQAQFPQLLSWLYRIENSQYLTHVSSLELKKKGLDGNEIHCELSTIVNPGGAL